MQKTVNYQLNKPQLTDFANIEEAINPSMDIIDAKLKELSDEKVSINNGAIADIELPAAWLESTVISDLNQIEAKRSIKGILSALVAGLRYVHGYFKSTKVVQVKANGFSGVAPYSCRVDVAGLRANDTPIISHKLQDGLTDAGIIKAAWKSYSCIDRIEVYDGYMIVKCYRKKPQQDIWLAVKGG
jgi:hypothetical protein|nr:MAG TPA: hypothetical protein [Caudoviricetes sp.]